MAKQHWEVIAESFTTAEGLWQKACNFFMWCDLNPIEINRTLASGKGAGTPVKTKQIRPYTIKGLCIHLGIDEEYLKDLCETKDKSDLYYIVASRIKYVIYVQNQEMAMIGEFNPIFTSKVLAMDRNETPNKKIVVELVQGVPPLSNSENEVLEKLDLENTVFNKDDF